jgi:acetyltransferase-like isoleucine patch superfamily enzyme
MGKSLTRNQVFLTSAYRALYAVHYAVKYGLMRLAAYLYFEPLARSRCSVVGKDLQLWKLPHFSGQPKICIGNNVNIYGEWSVESASQLGDSTLMIGDKVEIGHQVSFVLNGSIIVEDYVNIAGGTTIGDGKLSVSAQESKATRICTRAWIGRDSVIAKGVTIGEGAIIGSNSVVVNDVPAFSIAVGNPACVVLKDTRAKPVP